MLRYANESKIQSVVFDGDYYTIDEARDWLDKHRMRNNKVHVVHSTDDGHHVYRFRQYDPEILRTEGFNGYITKEPKAGLQLIIAYRDLKF